MGEKNEKKKLKKQQQTKKAPQTNLLAPKEVQLFMQGKDHISVLS